MKGCGETVKKYIILLLVTLISLNLSSASFAIQKPEDVFYSSLVKSEHGYREYSNATLNIRRLINASQLEKLDSELGKYSFTLSSIDSISEDIFFFASIYEDKNMLVKKYAIYSLNGDLLYSGYGRNANKEAVLKGEFNGWENSMGEDELSNQDPTR